VSPESCPSSNTIFTAYCPTGRISRIATSCLSTSSFAPWPKWPRTRGWRVDAQQLRRQMEARTVVEGDLELVALLVVDECRSGGDASSSSEPRRSTLGTHRQRPLLPAPAAVRSRRRRCSRRGLRPALAVPLDDGSCKHVRCAARRRSGRGCSDTRCRPPSGRCRGLHGDLLEGLQTVGRETGADNLDPADAGFAHCFRVSSGVGLQPFLAADADWKLQPHSSLTRPRVSASSPRSSGTSQ